MREDLVAYADYPLNPLLWKYVHASMFFFRGKYSLVKNLSIFRIFKTLEIFRKFENFWDSRVENSAQGDSNIFVTRFWLSISGFNRISRKIWFYLLFTEGEFFLPIRRVSVTYLIYRTIGNGCFQIFTKQKVPCNFITPLLNLRCFPKREGEKDENYSKHFFRISLISSYILQNFYWSPTFFLKRFQKCPYNVREIWPKKFLHFYLNYCRILPNFFRNIIKISPTTQKIF